MTFIFANKIVIKSNIPCLEEDLMFFKMWEEVIKKWREKGGKEEK